MAYEIHLPVFDGPFDLLLHLIQKNEVDIYDIPIADITAQYLAYLARMEALDLEIASEFLVMAATLLSIKARMLLPKPPPELAGDEEDFDPRMKLVRDLLEYRRIKEAARGLEAFYQERQQKFARPNNIGMYESLFAEQNPLAGKTLEDLTAALQPVWQRARQAEQVRTIRRDTVSIGTMTGRLLKRLAACPEGIVFADLFDEESTRLHVIVGFLALLELAKVSAVKVLQEDSDAAIYIIPADLSAGQELALEV